MRCLALLLPWMPSGVQSDGLRDAVVYPSSDVPETVKAGQLLELHVTLRLPLTPPPGVQQNAAIENWQVVLKSEAAWTRRGKRAPLQYTLPVMRIRPFAGDTYRLQVELPPWLPGGLYDAVVRGPGVEAAAPQSIRLTAGDEQFQSLPITTTSTPGEMVLHNSQPTHLRGTFQILLDKQETGATVVVNKVALRPLSVTFARVPIDGTRVLTFAVDVPPGTVEKPGMVHVRIQSESPISCSGEINLSPAAANDATAYRDIRFDSNDSPHSVIWDFGDGRYGSGNPVRHRFLLTNQAEITVWSLDAAGRICTSTADTTLNELSHSGGCSCIAVGK